MVKKRLIFTLLYSNGSFMLSRNFRLQRVGDVNWLEKNYKFSNIATSIDELIILDVTREAYDTVQFCEAVENVISDCFMPLALGGNVRSTEQAEMLLGSGADKIVINSVLQKDHKLVRDLVGSYGSQCIIASVDYRLVNHEIIVYIEHGQERLDNTFEDYLKVISDLGVGEIYLNSMDKDGTGQGYHMDILNHINSISHMPVIIAGGAGNYHHLLTGLNNSQVDAVATANLFNFIGNGLPSARQQLIESGCELAQW